MPGFAKQTAASQGAVDAFNIDDIADVTFYGFKFNPTNGRLTVDKIAGEEPVRLPEENTITANDYKQWLWTSRTLKFRWDSALKRALLVEVL